MSRTRHAAAALRLSGVLVLLALGLQGPVAAQEQAPAPAPPAPAGAAPDPAAPAAGAAAAAAPPAAAAPAQAQGALSDAEVDSLLARAAERFRVLASPRGDGILLLPNYGAPGVAVVEIVGGEVAVDGAEVPRGGLAQRLGADAPLVVSLSYVPPEVLLDRLGAEDAGDPDEDGGRPPGPASAPPPRRPPRRPPAPSRRSRPSRRTSTSTSTWTTAATSCASAGT